MNSTHSETMGEVTWEITRFELVYFDPLHKRWQIWQEAPSGIEPLNAGSPQFYRRQFHQLLRIIRNWFDGHLGRLSPRDGFQLSDLFVGDNEIKFDTNPDLDLLDHKAFWGHFLDHCSNNLQQYGVRPPEFLQEPTLRQLRPSTLTLQAKDALNLISVLPILRDWDLFGCWHRAWTGPKIAPGTFPSRRVPAESYWMEPFYMARLRRTGDLPNDGRGQPLPYEFLAQAKCCDLAVNEDALLFSEDNFFSPVYCLRPTQKETVLHYRAYAYLYDRLQESLTKKAIAPVDGDANPNSPPCSYIISYPVSCVGRIHFLQIQITTSSPSLVPVETLWTQWMAKVHPGFWTTEMKQFLSEELQRIKLSTFQALWSRNLAEATDLNPATFVTSLCSHAPILVPVRAITFDTRQWAYRRADWVNSPEDTVECQCSEDYGELGVEWAECTNTAGAKTQPTGIRQPISWIMGTSPQLHTIDVTLSSRTTDSAAEVLTIGRAVQVFEQQIMVGVQAMESIRARAQRDRNAAQAAVHEYFVDPKAQELFRTDPKYMNVRIPVSVDSFGVKEMSVDEVFAIGWPNRHDRDAAKEHVRRRTIPLHASQVFAVGPVKAMTHLSPIFWKGDWARLKAELEMRKDAITSLVVPTEHADWMTAWKNDAVALIVECINACPKFGNYPDGLSRTVVRTLHTKYRAIRKDAHADDFLGAWRKHADGRPTASRLEFTPVDGCSLYCPFPQSRLLATLHASILDVCTSSTVVAGGADAFLLFPVSVADECPWGESEPYLSRNIVYYRYQTHDVITRGDIRTSQVWKDLHASQVREYCDVVVGTSAGFFLLHSTADYGWKPVSPNALDTRNKDHNGVSWFELSEPNEVVVALFFDTWRTRQ